MMHAARKQGKIHVKFYGLLHMETSRDLYLSALCGHWMPFGRQKPLKKQVHKKRKYECTMNTIP